MLCFLRVLDRGSVIPLMYGNEAYPMQVSEGSTSSKNVFTNSSGLGMAVFSVWVLITFEITVFGYPFEARATLTCFSSSDLLSSVVGRLRDLWIRVVADHIIDFDNANIIDKGKFRCRLTLESWHTAKDKNADNNSKPLPRQYTALIKKTLS